ncbi:MAG: acyltransferase [Candidatus Thalassarchaeaceae archaeon]|nr:acyltransferase [Candidatus Thalassarchaeaceae archaeon]
MGLIRLLGEFRVWYYERAAGLKARRRFFSRMAARQVGSHGNDLSAAGPVRLTKDTHLGNNVNFNGLEVAGIGEVRIGDNFHSGKGCILLSDVHNYEGESLPYDSKTKACPITIGDNVWFGRNVMILGGVNIGNGAIIQAGSVVVSDIPDLGIAGGHPAKVFKTRDQSHYERLIEEKKFH